MPYYNFECERCGQDTIFKWNFTEHENQKNDVYCKHCNGKMFQRVERVRFGLKGNGWFDQGYGITNAETESNLNEEKRIEERYDTAMLKSQDMDLE